MANPKSTHIYLIVGYYYFFAAILASAGVLYLTASDWLVSVIPKNDYLVQMEPSDFILWGIVLFAAAGLDALLAAHLMKCSRIARVIAIVISVLGLFWAIFGLVAYAELFNIFFLVVHSYFLWILIYRYQLQESQI